MQIILIGCNAELAEAVRMADWQPSVRFRIYGNAEEIPPDLLHLQCPTIEPLDQWLESVNDSSSSLFILGDRFERQEALRLLAQNGIPMIVSHPAGTMIDGFELQMIQADTQAAIQPFVPGIDHPLVETLAQWVQGEETPIGRITQLSLLRPVDGVGREEVLRAFSRDALLLRKIMDRVERINAIGVDSVAAEDWSCLNVQMSGEASVVGRWSAASHQVGPADPSMAATIDLVGCSGRAQARLTPDIRQWSLHVTSPEPRAIPLDPAPSLDHLAARFSDPDTLDSQIEIDWEHACRAAELADAASESCRRNKTIAIYHQMPTEQSTFKGMMAAGGCLILLTLLTFLVVLQAVQTLKPNVGHWGGWSLFWPGLSLLLCLFLALQLFQLIYRSRDESGDARGK